MSNLSSIHFETQELKVITYSSKKMFEEVGYEGRAEADFVAYRKDDTYYEIVKNRYRDIFKPVFCESETETLEVVRMMICYIEEKLFYKELKNVL
jgi:hypothetical protein